MLPNTDVNNLFNLYVHIQELMNQHLLIDENIKENKLTTKEIDLESLEAAAANIIGLCQEIENDLNPAKNVIVSKLYTHI